MNSRKEQFHPISACDILRELLKQRPATSINKSAIGMTTNGKPVVSMSSPTVSYDEDTNMLLRAKFACNMDMVLSPNSNGKSIYIDRDEFEKESAKASMGRK